MQWTLEQVEEGVREVRDQIASDTLPGQLNMLATLDIDDCGSVGCIGGWMIYNRHKHETGRYARNVADINYAGLGNVVIQVRNIDDLRGRGLDRLFFDFDACATPDAVVEACDKWLSGNNDPWRK